MCVLWSVLNDVNLWQGIWEPTDDGCIVLGLSGSAFALMFKSECAFPEPVRILACCISCREEEKDGWDGRKFHQKVDGKGASVVLAKVRGQWIGGYNPRGWASLGGSRPSIAAFLFYQKFPFGGWQKLRVTRTGGMACGNDEYNNGIFFGSDGLVIPLNGDRPRIVASRLGYFYECGPDNRSTLLPTKGVDTLLDELYVVSGVYAKGEDIPNSGGVTDMGLY